MVVDALVELQLATPPEPVATVVGAPTLIPQAAAEEQTLSIFKMLPTVT